MKTAEEIIEALKTHAGLYPGEVTNDSLREAKCELFMMPIPEDFNSRISHIGNLLAQMCNNVRHKDDRLLLDLKTISSTLSYLINSSSFRDGEYFEFDKSLVNKRLRRK